MSKLYSNSDELLASIKSRAAVPIAQTSFTDGDLLNFATEEMNIKILPNVLAVREEFYVTEEAIPLVNNQSNYRIPYRALGGKVRYVLIRRNDGTLTPIAQLPPEAIVEYQASSFAYEESGFYLQNDELVILPPIQGVVNGSVLVKYYLKPNAIVSLNRGAKVQSIDFLTGDIQVETIPTNLSAGSQIDFIQASGNFKTLDFDINIVSASSMIINIAPSDIPTNLSVGDYLCSAGETVIPQIPSELHVMLAQAVACRVLEAIGDTQGLQNASAKLDDMQNKLMNIIDNRVEAPGRKIVNPNSFIRNNKYNRRWSY